jgi:hypothetical protein
MTTRFTFGLQLFTNCRFSFIMGLQGDASFSNTRTGFAGRGEANY